MLNTFGTVILLMAVASAEAMAQSTPSPEPIDPPVIAGPAGVSYRIHPRPPATPKAKTKTIATPAPDAMLLGEAAAASEPRFALDTLTESQLSILEKLNRVNAGGLKRLDRVVAPATWVDDELAYSPFPQTYRWAADKPKAIVVDQVAQAFAAYEYGTIVRWGPLSTGGTGQTPSGLFNLSWRSRGHYSSVDPSWYLPWYFNFIPSRGIAFHHYALPGRAASHGCARMLERDAQWLFEWGEPGQRGTKGTPVLVLGCPDPSKPWRSDDFLKSGIELPENPDPSQYECAGLMGSALATQRRTLR
jgi:lipoprotein-anchoring transpeptidase ErfK/SrfK